MNNEFATRYYRDGEDWPALAKRVASIVDDQTDRDYIEECIVNLDFIPSSPILMNAQSKMSMMACNLLGVEDNINDIFETLRKMAIITKFGGGVGLNFSRLRPNGAKLSYNPNGISSGPVSFMRLFDMAAEVIRQGGWRRGALMGILSVDHPDLDEFLNAKHQDGLLRNFNLSVSIKDLNRLPTDILIKLIKQAHHNGDPGFIFLDNINRDNPALHLYGPITGTNPCAEMPIYENESCCLASLVLPNVIDKLGDWSKLRNRVVMMGILLDTVIDKNVYYIPELERMAKSLRRIGIGVMGFETLLNKFGVPINSDEGRGIGNTIAKEMLIAADMVSNVLARELGPCVASKHRNVTRLCIAPTGHISNVAEVSSSIYPNLDTQLKMTPEEHIAHIMAWQQYIDNGVSYTVNIPQDAPWQLVLEIVTQAHDAGVKCISVYRDGSREGQPLKCSDGECEIK